MAEKQDLYFVKHKSTIIQRMQLKRDHTSSIRLQKPRSVYMLNRYPFIIRSQTVKRDHAASIDYRKQDPYKCKPHIHFPSTASNKDRSCFIIRLQKTRSVYI